MLKKIISRKNIGKFFKNKHDQFKIEEINPSRDWNIILFLFFFAGLSVIIFSSYMYWTINSGSFFITSVKIELPIETIDRSELAKTVKYYEMKNQLFQENKIRKQEVIDPSL